MEKILTFHNVIVLIKYKYIKYTHKYKNNYCYNIFLEKGLHKDKCNTKNF